MAFPPSERVIYAKNPLVEVACLLRFPPILAIASKPPADFQEEVRATYPFYETGIVLPAGIPAAISQQIAGVLAQLPIAGAGPTVHRFFTADRTVEIDLAGDFVRIKTTQYRRWEEFLEHINLAIQALESAHKPAFYLQAELRYVDVIDREKVGLSQSPWSDLIKNPIIGLLSDQSVGNLVLSTQCQTQVRIENDESMNLLHGLRASSIGRQAYGIDANFSTAVGNRTREQVLASLARFNREAGYFFRWSITSKLSAALQPKSL